MGLGGLLLAYTATARAIPTSGACNLQNVRNVELKLTSGQKCRQRFRENQCGNGRQHSSANYAAGKLRLWACQLGLNPGRIEGTIDRGATFSPCLIPFLYPSGHT